MRPISPKLREEMSNDTFYKYCCLAGKIDLSICDGRIEWHHALQFSGRQINAKFCILPLCQYHHRNVEKPAIKNIVTGIMLSRATDEELTKYSKAIDYKKLREKYSCPK